MDGEVIRGITNGDEAASIGENFNEANDGVRAIITKEKGPATLRSRLVLRFWVLETELDV